MEFYRPPQILSESGIFECFTKCTELVFIILIYFFNNDYFFRLFVDSPFCNFTSFKIAGLGLSDVKDITVKGLEIVKKCDRVYLESYTSLLTVGKDELEKFYGRSLVLADRELVEQNSDEILNEAESKDVGFLVVGDPFGATTHTDIILRAKEKNIPYHIVHNASILNAVGCCGLQLYSFGETVSIPFWTDSWKPNSFYDKILGNRSRGLHTLCLLDIKVKEPTLESLSKKKKEYLPPRFMTVNEAANQLLEILREKTEINLNLSENSYFEETKCIGLARIGSSTQKLIYCTLKEMTDATLGPPLHSLIIPGKLQILEEQYLSQLTEN